MALYTAQMHEPDAVWSLSLFDELSDVLSISTSQQKHIPTTTDPEILHYSSSDSESFYEDEDYCTDLTTPGSSIVSLDNHYNNAVGTFRDQEYPQLKGKVYLDHGGTTVSAIHTDRSSTTLTLSVLADRPVSDRRLLRGSHIQSIRKPSFRVDSFCSCRS